MAFKMPNTIQSRESSRDSGMEGVLHKMLRDLQPLERRAQRERQPQRQQVESELPLRGRPQLSSFLSRLCGGGVFF